jgi:myxalamid-type polyketide synthase MxaB
MFDSSERLEQLSSSQRLLLALKEARAKLEAVERSKSEPIAIIGMSCRFPGGANDPEAFWRLLRDGVDAITEVPPQRWDIDSYYDPDPDASGKIYTRFGGFLEQVDQFDPQFFGISPREAESLDPQQRLLLEVSWEALENAGVAANQLAGSRTGIFVGIGQNDYAQLHLNSGEPTRINAYDGTGNGFCFASGRLSYVLGLHGPSMAVDTACSSSLVAVHLACQSLRAGECNLALVGGVQLILSPEVTIFLSRTHALAPDGRCKTFDAAANGFGRGEGCGVLVLKRLSEAVADGDNILALIRGSAVNHDGPSSGLTVPNKLAQQTLIREALKNAKVEPSQVNYVEAHGTGTSLGDPIEIGALEAVLGKERSPEQPLAIGSVKTNIGHLEAAAGVAGLIKVVLALQHQEIPPHLHFKQPNPYINWDKLPVIVPTEPMPWIAGKQSRIAGVSSFGMSGTNTHIVLEEAPIAEPVQGSVERPAHLLTLSAKTATALKQLVARYENNLAANPALALGDLCYSANSGRSHFNQRLGVVASSSAELTQKLAAFTTGQEVPGVMSGQMPSSEPPKIAFLFTGQGSQYIGMGRQLYETQPTFRAALEQCAAILQPYLETPLLEILYPTQTAENLQVKIDQTAYTQPALFALEYALAQLWQSWGIKPDVAMGHSVGEYVAGCIAGVFSLEDGLKLIAHRGKLMQALPRIGEMVAVLADEATVREAVAPYQQKVAIAAINGPNSIVISGETEAVENIVAKLASQSVKTKKLQVSHAFHSPLMEPMLAEFERFATEVSYSQPRIGLISNVTGKLATSEIATPQYWVNHVRQAVQFAASMETLARLECAIFLEVGPQPTLLGMGRQCLANQEKVWLPSLRPGQDDWQQMLESLGTLYARGAKVDWNGFERDYAHHRLVLPTYPFERQRYWVESVEINRTAQFAKNGKVNKTLHPLLGQRLHLAGSREIHFESHISQHSPAFLQHHCIYDTVILPATAYLEMALKAGAIAFKSDKLLLEKVAIQQALMLSEDEQTTLQLVLKPEDTTAYSFQIFSASENDSEEAVWTVHASGVVRVGDGDPDSPQADLSSLQTQYPETVSVENYYRELRERGFGYGPSFQAIERLQKQEEQALAQIGLPDALTTTEVEDYHFHPALLDACLHMLASTFPDTGQQEVYLPVGVERLQVYCRPGHSLWSQVQNLQFNGIDRLSADLCLFDAVGKVVAKIEGFSFRRASRKALQRSIQQDLGDWLYQIAWEPQTLDTPVPAEQPGKWLIFADEGGTGLKLAQLLQKRGEECAIVSAGDAYKRLQEDRYQINSLASEDFERLLKDLDCDCKSLRGIVHLWSLDKITLQEAQARGCGSALHLVQALVHAQGTKKPRLWLLTQGAQPVAKEPLNLQQASLWGLGKVIALEHPELRCARLDLDPAAGQDDMPALVTELLAGDREDQVAYRQGTRYIARLKRQRSHLSQVEQQLQIPDNEPFQLKISSYGILENLTLKPMTRRSPKPEEVEIQVRAVGLNFRDVLNALGMLKEYTEQMGIADASDLPFGGECAGTVVAVGENVSHLKVGDEVIAAQAIGSLSSFVTVDARFVVPKPKALSFEEAATIPTTFLTAYYGLYRQAKLKAGDRVLIHAAAGGVGQAAVQLAQRAGAEIFATASPGKWDFLKSMGVQQVMNSRNVEFAEQITNLTEGEGVNVVFNSLNGEFIPKSFEVLGKEGRFVEIGKIGIWSESQVRAIRPDVAYLPFDLLDISTQDPGLIASMLGELMEKLKQGLLKPLPHKVFPLQDVVSAFRYMAQAKHIGKVVVTIPESSPQQEPIRGDNSYLITGGLGALGLKIARWMVDQGAKHLILTGRREASEAARQKIEQIEKAGAQVLIVKSDVSDWEDASQLFLTVKDSMPPLRGIIHAAGVLDDGMLLGQSWERFSRVMAPKVAGTWNLHSLTRDLPLDFFVCFSSVASFLGSPGQGNYAAANAFMDALSHHRQALGLPGVSINWGPWGDSGMAASLNSHDRDRRIEQGIKSIAPERGLQVLGEVLEQDVAQVGVLPVDWSKFIEQFPRDFEFPLLDEFAATTEPTPAQKSKFLEQLEAAVPSERPTLLMTHIRSQIAKILGLSSAEQIAPRQRLFDLGLDSLMAIELKNKLEANLGQSLRSTLLFDYPTLEALVDYLAQEMGLLEPVEPAETSQAEVKDEELDAFLAEIDQVSDREIRQQLIESPAQN